MRGAEKRAACLFVCLGGLEEPRFLKSIALPLPALGSVCECDDLETHK